MKLIYRECNFQFCSWPFSLYANNELWFVLMLSYCQKVLQHCEFCLQESSSEFEVVNMEGKTAPETQPVSFKDVWKSSPVWVYSVSNIPYSAVCERAHEWHRFQSLQLLSCFLLPFLIRDLLILMNQHICMRLFPEWLARETPGFC